MQLYSYIKPYLEDLECTWSMTKEIPCFDLNFGESDFSIRFSLENTSIKMTISMDETDNTPRSVSIFTSNLCSEIVFGMQEFVFDLKHEDDLVNYLYNRGVEALLKFNKSKIASDFSGTCYYISFNDKIYNVLSEKILKQVLMSETKYSTSLLHALVTFDDNKNEIYMLRNDREYIEAFNSFKHYIETQSSKGMRSLFMYNRLQNNVPDARKDSMKRTKI